VSADNDATRAARRLSRALRAKSDALIKKAAVLHARSVALRQRIGRPPWSHARVLNIEHHEPSRSLRTRTLENAGYTVTEATSVEHALAVGTDTALDLALLNIGLPDGDRFELCAQLKTDRPTLHVVMISSIYRTGTARRRWMEAGADEYLLDPIPGHRLVRTLDRVLRLTLDPGESSVITTDAFGRIAGLNTMACRLLNLSARGALGRNLLTFVGADREKVAKSLALAAGGQFVQDELVLRPRERKPLTVEVDFDGGEHRSSTVEWTIRHVPDAGTPEDLWREGYVSL
jgi:CheY-like chemotaxis protein